MAKITYLNPPLSETVLSIQFDPLPSLSAGYLGAFWSANLRNQYDVLRDATVIDQVVELTEPARIRRLPSIRLTDPSVRLIMRSPNDDSMVQLQNGRIIYNWIKTGANTYPRFGPSLIELLRVGHLFETFILNEKIGTWKPN